MCDIDFGRPSEGLINNAIALRQTNQLSQLLFIGVSVQIEVQSNLLESDGNIFGDSQSAAKVEITLGADDCVAQLNIQSSGHRAQGNASTGYQCLQQHITRARTKPVASGSR